MNSVNSFSSTKPVVEDHVFADAQVPRQPLQAQPVALALLAHQGRVRRPEHDVDEVRELREDFRQRPEHVFNALVRRK